jgi:hypothetical protein
MKYSKTMLKSTHWKNRKQNSVMWTENVTFKARFMTMGRISQKNKTKFKQWSQRSVPLSFYKCSWSTSSLCFSTNHFVFSNNTAIVFIFLNLYTVMEHSNELFRIVSKSPLKYKGSSSIKITLLQIMHGMLTLC